MNQSIEKSQQDVPCYMYVSIASSTTRSTGKHFGATELVVEHTTCPTLLGCVGLGPTKDLTTFVLSGGLDKALCELAMTQHPGPLLGGGMQLMPLAPFVRGRTGQQNRMVAL